MSINMAVNFRTLFLNSSRVYFGWMRRSILKGSTVWDSKCLDGSSRFMSIAPEKPEAEEKKKKKIPEIRINLFFKDKTLTVTTLDDATKIAKRRGMLLHKAENPPKYMTVGEREAYELINPDQIFGQHQAQKFKEAGFKGSKQMQMGSKIAEYDLNTKVKKMNKWLESGYVTEVLIISQSTGSDLEHTAKLIEPKLIHAKLPGTVRKKSQTSLKISYEPIKEEAK